MSNTTGLHEASGAAAQGKCRKVELIEHDDGSLSYRPILKVKGLQCDLGEYDTGRWGG
jgi:hypothetical protein